MEESKIKAFNIDDMEGTFDILFIGEPEPKRLVITDGVMNSYGKWMYLMGIDGTVYNYSTVISVKQIH